MEKIQEYHAGTLLVLITSLVLITKFNFDHSYFTDKSVHKADLFYSTVDLLMLQNYIRIRI